MEWWHWLAIGLVLIALEMAASGGFYVVFFGVAALIIGGLHALDFAGPLWIQLLLFSLISIVSLVAFRNPIMHALKLDGGAPDVDTLVGEIAVPLEPIVPGAVGRAELRGSAWTARNAGSSTLATGQRCRVVRVDRLVLCIEPEAGARSGA